MIIRQAGINEIPLLCEIRKIQLIDEGITPTEPIDAELSDFFHQKLAADQLYELLAYEEETLVATAAVLFMDYPPTYTNKSGRVAYITNMYTAPLFRKRGIARQMLQQLEKEILRRGVEVIRLRASVYGQPVYEKCGYQKEKDWMIKKIHID